MVFVCVMFAFWFIFAFIAVYNPQGLDMDGDGLIDRTDLREWGRVAAAQAKALAAEDAGWGVGGKFAPEKTVAEVPIEWNGIAISLKQGAKSSVTFRLVFSLILSSHTEHACAVPVFFFRLHLMCAHLFMPYTIRSPPKPARRRLAKVTHSAIRGLLMKSKQSSTILGLLAALPTMTA